MSNAGEAELDLFAMPNKRQPRLAYAQLLSRQEAESHS